MSLYEQVEWFISCSKNILNLLHWHLEHLAWRKATAVKQPDDFWRMWTGSIRAGGGKGSVVDNEGDWGGRKGEGRAGECKEVRVELGREGRREVHGRESGGEGERKVTSERGKGRGKGTGWQRGMGRKGERRGGEEGERKDARERGGKKTGVEGGGGRDR